MRQLSGTLGVGLLFGFRLSRIGLSSWDEVHRMFVFADLRLFLSFMAAVVLLVPTTLLWKRFFPGRVRFGPRPVHNGTLLGGALFGAGWAISGACPSIALVQLGEGQLAALLTLAGIVAGNWLCAVMQQRYLRWDPGSCADE
jgi:uncharacterized membrane protein YedE/YeeE